MSDMRARNLSIPREEIAAFCERHQIATLSLFGSVLRDDFHANSDVDVLVEFEPGCTPGLAFFGMQRELAAIIGRRVDMNTPAMLSPYIRPRVEREMEMCFVRADWAVKTTATTTRSVLKDTELPVEPPVSFRRLCVVVARDFSRTGNSSLRSVLLPALPDQTLSIV